MDAVSVLIVDDQAPYRDALRSLFARMPDFIVVGEASSGEDAMALVDSLEPALVLMDVVMDGMGGIAATQSIVAGHPDVVVVLISTYELDEVPGGARACGACAYLGKGELSAEAVRRIWRDRRQLSLTGC